MHYPTVLSSIILWMIVLILSPQMFDRGCSVPFVENCILIVMYPSSISITSMSATLAFEMLLLVWQPMSLQNTIHLYGIPYW